MRLCIRCNQREVLKPSPKLSFSQCAACEIDARWNRNSRKMIKRELTALTLLTIALIVLGFYVFHAI